MTDVLRWLIDDTGFTPRAYCGTGWTDGLRWLHAGSDLLIGLSYVAIPLILLFFILRRGMPFTGILWLFGAFILACGTGHLIEAVMFQHPVYHLSGVVKAVTAVVSWVTVAALIPAAPRVVRAAAAMTARVPAEILDAERDAEPTSARGYVAAVLAAVLAVAVRAALDPLLDGDQAFVIPLLAVVAVAWYGGLGPGVVTLLLSMTVVTYLFVEPRYSLVVSRFPDQLATGLFLFAGVWCATLGEAQKQNRRKAAAVLDAVMLKQTELEAEAARRERSEAALQAGEARYRRLTESIPQLVWTCRADGYCDYLSRQWVEYTGVPMADQLGWSWLDRIHPDDRDRAADAWTTAVAGRADYDLEYRIRRQDAAYRWFQTRGSPVRDASGATLHWLGTCTDIDDRKRAEDTLAEQAGLAALRADVGVAIGGDDPLPDVLRRCAEAAVHHLGAAFARVWTLNEAAGVLELRASAGQYTHTDGPHARVRVGQFKIGRIAESRRPHLSNDVPNDPEVSDQAWAKREGMVAFAGYPLLLGERVLGVAALFARRPLSPTVLADLGPLFEGVAQYIDRKRAEAALKASEVRFRLLTETIPQIVWNADASGRTTYFNTRWVEYTGVPVGDAVARGWLAAVHPDDAVRVDAAWAATVAEGDGTFAHEVRLRRAADGAYRWFLTVAIPLHRADGTVDQWIGSMADIHDQKEHAATLGAMVADRTAALSTEVEERRKAEAAVRKQRQFLDVILENVADGIVACDEGGTLTLFNRATREFHGLPAEPLPPDQWAGRYSLYRADGVTPLPQDEVPLFRALRGEIVRDAEMVVAPRNGTPRVLLASGQPLTDPAGANLGAVVSMRDVTERKRADEQFRRFAEELQRSNGELEKFAYVASHDLQEPLRKIQAFGDRLGTKFKDKLDDQGRDYLDRMQSSAARMRQLINDLLAFSRVTTKTQPFRRVDLNKVAADAVDDLHDRIQQTNGVVDVGPLPTIDADPTQARQLLQNLIGNALKFHKPGEAARVTVRAETATEPGQDGGPPRAVCRLTVSDDGIGFDEKYLDRIFQVFQRLHGRGEYEGTGVGLAICRKIIDRHGGAVTARSSPGNGAAFVVTLPLRHPTRATP